MSLQDKAACVTSKCMLRIACCKRPVENYRMKSRVIPKQNSGKSHFPVDQLSVQKIKRGLLYAAMRSDEPRDIAFRRIILSIPPGKVSTYGRVASAAGYPRFHRAVARLLRTDPPDQLPWHRVLGAGGEIKLRGAAAHEQRARLKLEGVRFRGERVDMERFEHALKPWEVYEDLPI
jgi:methylated-DNA-protein-cysteine methyltransferase-like protein